MRQPLRFQIMMPMLALMLSAIAGVSALNAYLAAGQAQRRIEQQLDEIVTTLDQSSFPLTDAVMRQMRGLSGAEFVLVDDGGAVVASSWEPATGERSLDDWHRSWNDRHHPVQLRRRRQLGGRTYFHTAIRLERIIPGSPDRLQILYPEQEYRDAWTRATYPPVLIGLVASCFVVAVAAWVASRVSRPLTGLQRQVTRISQGNYSPLSLPLRDDEIRDLAQSINRMAAMLDQYERGVRQAERLNTLAQLGGGIAHQMRNAATGCRMAIDLLADELRLSTDCDNLVVARRQLELMERYLQRFLALGQPSRQERPQAIDLGQLVDDVLPLLRPAGQHAKVALVWQRPPETHVIQGVPDELEQMIINLVLNAIEAAQQLPPEGNAPDTAPERPSQVRLRVLSSAAGEVELLVEDTGPGPPVEIQSTLFEPFATTKAGGAGLGLSVARQAAERQGGTIGWERISGWTQFRVRFTQTLSTTSERSTDKVSA
jgi:signal transduction histidine kinase